MEIDDDGCHLSWAATAAAELVREKARGKPVAKNVSVKLLTTAKVSVPSVVVSL